MRGWWPQSQISKWEVSENAISLIWFLSFSKDTKWIRKEKDRHLRHSLPLLWHVCKESRFWQIEVFHTIRLLQVVRILLMLLDWYVLLNVWPKSFLHAHPPAPPLHSVCPPLSPTWTHVSQVSHVSALHQQKRDKNTDIITHTLFSVQTLMPWILIQSYTHTFVNSYAYQFAHLQMSQKQYPPS